MHVGNWHIANLYQLRLLVCYLEFIEGYDSRITRRMAEINF